MKKELENIIDKDINSQLKFHNGSCQLIKVEDSVAYIQLSGGCSGCPGRQHTFLKGIKPYLIENVDGLKDVQLVRE